MKNIFKRLQKLNPYLESKSAFFREPTKEEYEKMHEAFIACGLIPDQFFSSFGRRVWNDCINKGRELVENSGKEKAK